MTKPLENITEQEIKTLDRRELLLNLSRTAYSLYIPFSALAKAVILNKNPIDQISEQGTGSITLALAGLAVAGFGAIMKQSNDTAEMQTICENTYNDEEKIVDTGQYESCRNPCYFAQTLMATGFLMMAPAVDTLAAFVGYLGLTEWNARTEEKRCVLQFGDKYRQYVEKVPRWPKLLGGNKIK